MTSERHSQAMATTSCVLFPRPISRAWSIVFGVCRTLAPKCCCYSYCYCSAAATAAATVSEGLLLTKIIATILFL
jgi:hypothetical protein